MSMTRLRGRSTLLRLVLGAILALTILGSSRADKALKKSAVTEYAIDDNEVTTLQAMGQSKNTGKNMK